MHYKSFLVVCAILSHASCGRIDAHHHRAAEEVKPTTEKSHIDLIMENMEPSVSEDHIKVLKMESGSVYDSSAKGKPELFRKMTKKLHAITQTDFDENESTTSLRPESTSHSHVYERTAQTHTTVHKTKKEKSKVTSTTEMSQTVHLARARRSFTKAEVESFSEMGKVFSESFKKFNDDAAKAQKDFMSFMKKLDDISVAHDAHN